MISKTCLMMCSGHISSTETQSEPVTEIETETNFANSLSKFSLKLDACAH